jgi:hypothetical protein
MKYKATERYSSGTERCYFGIETGHLHKISQTMPTHKRVPVEELREFIKCREIVMKIAVGALKPDDAIELCRMAIATSVIEKL